MCYRDPSEGVYLRDAQTFVEVGGDDNGESRALAEFAGDLNLTLMVCNYLEADRESQAGADPDTLGCKTGVEDFL